MRLCPDVRAQRQIELEKARRFISVPDLMQFSSAAAVSSPGRLPGSRYAATIALWRGRSVAGNCRTAPAAACQIVAAPGARYSARTMLIVAEPLSEAGVQGGVV